MAAGVRIDDDWKAAVSAAMDQFLEERLGPDIADNARRFCPVDTGALKASIEHHVQEDGHLIVSASGGGEDGNGNLFVSRRAGREGGVETRPVHHVEEEGRTYAVYVEMGHRVYHPSTGVTGPELVPPQPFLRPALYQQRGG